MCLPCASVSSWKFLRAKLCIGFRRGRSGGCARRFPDGGVATRGAGTLEPAVTAAARPDAGYVCA